MTVAAGSRLGPYEILALLGAGGMGEVYRAKDPRLGRDVAVKVLPASFSDDPDRLRRFEQEARAAGLLNHPNITAVYDIGAHDGAPYVVSELLEGETLRAALAGGRFSLRKAIEHAIQLAQGLAAAHEKGIVHRDLKPENVFVTNEGRVKILDFGLAKLTHAEEGGSTEHTNLPTAAGTEPGVVLGTMGYMSPEQVRGRPADARSDIFAFGAILFEMLSGKRAFQGDSAADTMSAILREDPPDLSVTNQNVPPGLERILRHCLEKNAAQRFQSARDLAFDLEALSGVSTPRGTTAAGLAPMRARRVLPLAIAGVVVAAAIAGAYLAGKRQGSVPPPSFSQLSFRRGQIYAARFAPDGQTVLYSASWEGRPIEIFVNRLESAESRSYGVTGADLLAISASGELALSLNNRNSGAFERSGTLARASVAGGAAPREVEEGVLWADWSPDGKDLAIVRHAPGGKQRLEFPIGKVLFETEGWISHPRVSPDGSEVAFVDHPLQGDDGGSIGLVDRAGEKKNISSTFASLQGVAWPPGGGEVWFSGATVGFNRSLHAVTRSGKQRVLARATGGLVLQDVAKDGRVLVTQEKSRQEMYGRFEAEAKDRDLSWLDWSLAADISADGRTVLFDESGEGGGKGYSVYVRKADGSPAVRLGEGSVQTLSPDARWVLAIVSSTSEPQLVAYPTGAGQVKTFSHEGLTVQEAGWLPDGKRILMNANEAGRGVRIYVRNFEGGGKPRAVTPEGYRAFPRSVSRDGKSVVVRGPDRRFYVYPLEGGEPVPVPGLAAEGERPESWTADGRLYILARGVPVKVFVLDPATGRRELWKEILPADSAGVAPIGGVRVAPDGKSYAYSFMRVLSELFLVDGVR